MQQQQWYRPPVQQYIQPYPSSTPKYPQQYAAPVYRQPPPQMPYQTYIMPYPPATPMYPGVHQYIAPSQNYAPPQMYYYNFR
jgi:hypothetical protein